MPVTCIYIYIKQIPLLYRPPNLNATVSNSNIICIKQNNSEVLIFLDSFFKTYKIQQQTQELLGASVQNTMILIFRFYQYKDKGDIPNLLNDVLSQNY